MKHIIQAGSSSVTDLQKKNIICIFALGKQLFHYQLELPLNQEHHLHEITTYICSLQMQSSLL